MSIRGYTFSAKLSVNVKEAIQNEYVFTAESSERKLAQQTWCMDYLCEGHCSCHVDGMPASVRPLHTVHIYPPGKTFYERKLDNVHLRSYWIIFDGIFPFLEKHCRNSLGFMQIHDSDQLLLSYFKDAARAAARGTRGYWQTLGVFANLLDRLEENLSQLHGGNDDFRFEIRNDQSRNLALSEQVQIFLEQNYHQKIYLEMLANKLGVSLSLLTHTYRQETGESVIDTLNSIRLEQSMPLLKNGMKLKNIACEIGFANEFYYSRLFKKKYGLSPKQWLVKQD